MEASENTKHPATYSVGTLSYTKAGLFVLFGWLLWGDFVFALMEMVMPTLLPLELKAHGATNQQIIIIISTLSMILNSIMNPIISYRSDRFRSRWGRRRPFIFITTPFVVFFLATIPFAPEILRGITSIKVIEKAFALAPVAPIILMFGILVAGFQIFNMFISSVYYYLVPDVVPKDHLGRFFSLFRIVGSAAGMFFNCFILGHAEEHMKAIFSITAVVLPNSA